MPDVWLNDEVINLYMQLLARHDEERCARETGRLRNHYFNSFFLTQLDGQSGYNYGGVRRWTRKVDVFKVSKVFVPVNINNVHWCMAVVCMQAREIRYLDSMGGPGRRCCSALQRWVEDESADKRQLKYSTKDWAVVPPPPGTPQQENG
ncbi:unnamed protein product, partial [Phaeothamnion confervicola]